MSKLVIKIAISSMSYTKEKEFTAYKQIYDVTSIGKRVNATLRCHTDDIKKRFDKESFDKMNIESDLQSNRASIMFLVDSEDEVNVEEIVEKLKNAIIDKMELQIGQFIEYRNSILNQENYRLVSSDSY